MLKFQIDLFLLPYRRHAGKYLQQRVHGRKKTRRKWLVLEKESNLRCFQHRQDEPFVFMENFARFLQRFHGAGNADPVGSG